jgi:hypothetical protein
MPISGVNEAEDVERLEPETAEPSVKIDLSEPEQDDDGDEPPARAAKGDAPQKMERDKVTGKWTQKRQEKEVKFRANKAFEAERQAFDRRITEMQQAGGRRIAELEARIARGVPAGAPAADPAEAELNSIGQQLAAELKLIEADEKHGYDRYNKLRQEEYRIVARQEHAKLMRATQAAQPAPNVYTARGPIIESEFPWTTIPACKPLNAKAWAYRTYLIEVEGRPDTIDTDRESLAHIQAQFGAQYGLQTPARPTQQQRSAYARPAPGAQGRDTSPTTIELPAYAVEGSGLSPAQLSAALRNTNGR